MKALALIVFAALAGCTPAERSREAHSGDQPPASSPSAPSPIVPAQPAPKTLAGEWKVVAIDGQDFNEPYGLALSADAREIWWAPRCAGMVKGYTIEGHAIRIGRAPSLGPQPAPGTPPPPVCAIGLPARLSEAVRALDAATIIRRTSSNGVELSGGGHSLLLFSQ